MRGQEIPLVSLDTQVQNNTQYHSRPILENEIKDIHVEHVAVLANNAIVDTAVEGFKTIYLFIKGVGEVSADNTNYEIVPETIFLPNSIVDITIKCQVCKLSAQDQLDLQQLPSKNTQYAYHAKFSDCQSYSEAIKSPNTVSRTILSNEYIPRIAMGTVQTTGPDKVAAHEHPMLEQLFLGLSENNCTVYADDDEVNFPQYSVVHIPLGSSHSVSVEKDKVMYYVWMDFFLDKKGEQWLKTHNVDGEL